jgi:F-type H+-transporting ATPase subunit gamma
MMQRTATSVMPLALAANNAMLQQQNRGMATLKQISMRLKSVKNIQKITQSMKMVSAAKYTRAERDLRACRPIGEGSKQFYEKAEVAVPENTTESKRLMVAISSDRGNNKTAFNYCYEF